MRADQYAQPSAGTGFRTRSTRLTLGRVFCAGRDTATPPVATRRGSGVTTTGADAGPVAAARARGSTGVPGRWCKATALNATARSTTTWAAANRWTRGDAENQAPVTRTWANTAVRTAICPNSSSGLRGAGGPPRGPCRLVSRRPPPGSLAADGRPPHAGAARGAGQAQGTGAARRFRALRRATALEGQDDGPRAHRAPAGRGIVRGARPAGPLTCDRERRAALHRRRHHWVGHGRRPQGVRVLPGLHGVRRVTRRGVRREGPQGHGPGDVG